MKKFMYSLLILFFSYSFVFADGFIDFNTTSDLTTYFNPDTSTVEFTSSSSGGINSSGSVTVPSISNDIWTHKTGLSILNTVGDIYTLSSYVYISGNAGYGGIGFATANQNEDGTTTASPAPAVALGVGFHSGGGSFENNGVETPLTWIDCQGDCILVSQWYKIVFTMEVVSASTYNLKVEIFNTDSIGTVSSTPNVVRTLANVTNASIGAATTLYPYFGNAGSRIGFVDDIDFQNKSSSILDNNNIRLGDGASGSINELNNFKQPFYFDTTNSVWNQLTIGTNPLDFALGIDGDGTNEWNVNGTVLSTNGGTTYALSNRVIDKTGFTVTSGNKGYGTLISTGDMVIGGKTVQVKNTYELPQTSNYVKMTTKITNNSGSAISNVRAWIGTRDDYIGAVDGPSKYKGNIVNGVFTPITTASEKAAVLKIDNGTSGVLFYSTLSTANSAINSCCSFSNVYNNDPQGSAISSTGDGSYGMFFRLADLANGASDEFTVYYAAGQVTELANIAQQVSNAASISVDEDNILTFSSNEFKDSSGNIFPQIKVTALPTNGILKVSGTNVTLNQEIVSANYTNVTYTPNANYNGTDIFTWQGYIINVYGSDKNTTMSVNAINDAPTFNSTPVTSVDEDTLYNYEFSATDIDDYDYNLSWSINKPSWLNLTQETNITVSTYSTSTGRGLISDNKVNGNLYLADWGNKKIIKITSAGVASDFAITKTEPMGMDFDSHGNLYVGHRSSLVNEHQILKIDSSGNVTVFAGAGPAGQTNANGTLASFTSPMGVAVDSQDNVFVADAENHIIRKIDSDGNVTTFAGSVGLSGIVNATGTAAKFNYPRALAIDSNDNIFVADQNNYVIRKITPAGVVTTFAGSGAIGSSDGVGTAASFSGIILDLTIDIYDNIYVADYSNDKVRKITPDGTVITLAGVTLNADIDGDVSVASFPSVAGVAVDINGTVFATVDSTKIKKIDIKTINTLSGTPTNADVGVHDINLTVSDGSSTVEQNFQITVVNVNDAPTITSTAITSVNQDSTYSYMLDATDVDGDSLTWATTLPSWLTLNNATSIFTEVGTAGFSVSQASYTSLAFDSNNIPYVAYRDVGNGSKTTVMRFNGTAWEVVGTAGFSAGTVYYISLAFDSNDIPYVAYEDDSDGYKATVMKYNGTSWEVVGAKCFSAGGVNYTSLAFDSNNTPYVAYQDSGNSGKATVMKFDGTSWVNVGTAGFSASIAYDTSLAFDSSDTPYVAYQDYGNGSKATLMKYNGQSWTSVGMAGFSAGTAYYTSLAFDSYDNPYVAYQDGSNSNKVTLMKYNGQSWASVGMAGFSAGEVNYLSLAFDSSDTPYVAYEDIGNSDRATVMKYNGTSWVNVGTAGFSTSVAYDISLAFDSSNTPYVAYQDGGNSYKATVMKLESPTLIGIPTNADVGVHDVNLTLSDGTITVEQNFQITVANVNDAPIVTSTAITSVNENSSYSYLLTATDADGNSLSWSVNSNATLPTWLTLSSETLVTTLAGGSTSGFADGTGTAASFYYPFGIAVDSGGNLYVADTYNHKIRKITPEGVTTTFAGSGTSGFADGTGTAALFNSPSDIAVDGGGNVYVTDTNNNKIRKITPEGVTTTFAGGSTGGSTDGTGTAALFNSPSGIAVDGGGNVYVTDTFSHKIRKITPAGVVTTLAGSTSGFADGTGTAALFQYPQGITIDSGGNLYVADTYNHKIRKITPAGVVTTLAGGSTSGSTDGTGTAALFQYPRDITVDGGGNVYVPDTSNHKIRKITPNGVATTFAGSTWGFADGTGTAALFYYPYGIAVDSGGNLYVADTYNHKIRKISTTTTLFGTPNNADVGVHDVNLTITDGVTPVEHNFQITVVNVNDAPILASITTQTQSEDFSDFNIILSATDVDSVNLTYTALSHDTSKANVTVNGNILTISSVPNANGVVTIDISVSDGSLTDTKSFDLNITAVNDAPIYLNSGNTVEYFGDSNLSGGINFEVTEELLTAAGSIINITSYGKPSFIDIDGDGNLDMTVGRVDGTLSYYENNGTLNSASFLTAVTLSDTVGVIDVGGYSAPNFADMDNDGDFDLVVGASDGTLHYYENIGTANSPSFTTAVILNDTGGVINVGAYSTPNFVDIDNDGDLDLIVGESIGNLNYYENIGTPSSATFAAGVFLSNTAGVISGFTYSAPSFADVDSDNDLDMIVGNINGTLNYYENNGTPSSPSFLTPVLVTNSGVTMNFTNYSTPSFVDLNGDNYFDLVVGTGNGNLHYFEKIVSNQLLFTISENNTTITTLSGYDLEGDTFSFAIDNSYLDSASFSINSSTGALSFNAAPDFESPTDVGADNVYDVNLTISDGNLTNWTVAQITVSNVDEAPILEALNNLTKAEDDNNFSIDLNATDIDGDTIVYTTSSSNLNIATATIVGTQLVVTPILNANGLITVEVNATANGQSATQIFELNITAVDDAPIFNFTIPTQTIDEDTAPYSLPLIESATDTESDSFTYTATSNDTTLLHVSVVQNSGITITPQPNQYGTTTVDVVVTQDSNSSLYDSYSFTITISPVNDAPTIDTSFLNIAIAEDNGISNYELNISDTEGSSLNLYVESNNTNILTVTPNWINSLNQAAWNNQRLDFNLTTVADANGMVRITITTDDGELNTTKSFDVNVTALNDAPILTQELNQTQPEDFSDFNLTLSATDVDSANLIYTALSHDTSKANVTVNGNILTISSLPNANGVVIIDVSVTDGSFTDTKSFELTITAVDDAPTLQPLPNIIKSEDDSNFTIDLNATDIDGNTITYTISSSNINIATVSIVNGTVVVTPIANANGLITVEVNATANGQSASQSFELNITAVNDAPTIDTLFTDMTISEDNGTTNYELNISDIEDDELQVTVESNNTNILVVSSNWTNNLLSGNYKNNPLDFNLTTVANANGIVRISINVNDGDKNATQYFDVNVTAVDDAPFLDTIQKQFINEDSTDLNISLNSFDAEGNSILYTAASSNSSIAMVNIVDGKIVISPMANAYGVITVEVNATVNGLTTTQSFDVEILNINDAPNLAPIDAIVKDEDFTPFNLTITPSDSDGDNLKVTVDVNDSSIISISPNTTDWIPNSTYSGGLNLLITPIANRYGTVELNVTVEDSSGAKTNEQFTLTVLSVNDIPNIGSIQQLNISMNNQCAYIIDVPNDIEGQNVVFRVKENSNFPDWLQLQYVEPEYISIAAGVLNTRGSNGDGGYATLATLSSPTATAIDSHNNLYIVDTLNHAIRKVDNNGVITTIAGTLGVSGYAGDNGLATSAQLNQPYGIKIDVHDNIYIADTFNHAIRKVDTNGIITTIAGTLGVSGYTGDNGLATLAQLNKPYDVEIDANNNLYIADTFNHAAREVDSEGLITTIAGTLGVSGNAGDNGLATSAQLISPIYISKDNNNNLYLYDAGAKKIRMIGIDNIIHTMTSTPNTGASFTIKREFGMTIGSDNIIYIADNADNVIKKMKKGYILLSGNPTNVEIGEYKVTFEISDGNGKNEYDFNVSVTDATFNPNYRGFSFLTNSDSDKKYILLNKGWNLISANINMNEIPDAIKLIWKWQDKKWQLYINTKNQIQKENALKVYDEIQDISNNSGVWVYVDNTIQLEVLQNTPQTDITSFGSGFTLAGANRKININELACSNGKVISVFAYRDSNWLIDEKNSLLYKLGRVYQIEENEGFWINCE